MSCCTIQEEEPRRGKRLQGKGKRREWGSDMENVIEVEGLTKEFDGLVAVDHISFAVKKGEVFGFLGPNGAGKTTAIKMLTTLLNPTSGSAKICGYDVVKERDEVRRCIGIVFQDRSSDWLLTGRENLDFHARMYSMSKEAREERISQVLDLLELKGKENTKLRDLPDGVQRRFEVARGFMLYPKVLFLDEPTIGFDIQARRDLWDYIRKANEQEGVTIMLTTHYIEEADYLCDRVAIIDNGKLVAIDTPERLKEAVGTELISVQIANKENGDFISLVKGLKWVKNIEEHVSSLVLSVEGGDTRVAELVELADDNGFAVSAIDSRKPSLEDSFVHFTGRTIREAEGSLKEQRRARMARRRGRR
jgi:ABC-2 type transport system ATP-binding protein